MYSHCIYCSRSLGRNHSLEAFPVGARVAVDARAGRLWAICPRCARWNLAPLEERWEAIEQAERIFRDTPLRVQRENVGLARLPDGGRLLRVGEAAGGELAAWRYGEALTARWRRGPNRLLRGIPRRLRGWIGGRPGAGELAALLAARGDRRVVCRIPADQSPTASELTVLRGHLRGAVLQRVDAGIGVYLPAASTAALPVRIPGLWLRGLHEQMLITGDAARSALSRALVDVNAAGAPGRVLDEALAAIQHAGGSAEFVARAADAGVTVQLPHRTPADPAGWDGYWNRRAEHEGVPGEARPAWRRRVAAGVWHPGRSGSALLALEMALHEEAERRALRGELAVLTAAWREAEEIAVLADRLAAEDDTRAFRRGGAGAT